MKSSQSAVVSHAKKLNVSPISEWMILLSFFLVVLSGYHINYVLTGEEWSFFTELKTIFHW